MTRTGPSKAGRWLPRNAGVAGPGLLAVALVVAGCASQPPASLETARASVSNARTDQEIQRLAADELAAAEESLQRAEAAWDNDASREEVEHLAYLVERRVAIAEAAAEEEQAEAEIEDLNAELDEVRLEARERDVELAERRADEAESELEQLQREMQAEQTERGLVLTLGDILFDVDGAELKPGGQQQLARLAEFLRQNPERKLLIEGHTDSTASDAYNLQLSQRRANAVQDFLITQGIEPTRMEARGYGEQLPVATNETAAGRQENRRVEIVILEEGAPLPPPRAALR